MKPTFQLTWVKSENTKDGCEGCDMQSVNHSCDSANQWSRSAGNIDCAAGDVIFKIVEYNQALHLERLLTSALANAERCRAEYIGTDDKGKETVLPMFKNIVAAYDKDIDLIKRFSKEPN